MERGLITDNNLEEATIMGKLSISSDSPVNNVETTLKLNGSVVPFNFRQNDKLVVKFETYPDALANDLLVKPRDI